MIHAARRVAHCGQEPPRSPRLYVLSVALSLCACASQDGSAATAATAATTATPEAAPPEPRAEIKIAVASVQLIQDCPDPAEAPAGAAAAADSTAPAAVPPPPAPVAAQQEMAPGAAAKRMAPGSNWQPPCTQSTVQLSLTNTGDREGKVRVNGIKIFDVATKRELGQITSRKPSLWNDTGVYQAWDERVAPGATVKVAYRLSDPDWEQIHKLVGETENLYARPLLLEVDIAIDDRTQTARSPEFTRQEVHLVVT